jgi:hypothetical protein
MDDKELIKKVKNSFKAKKSRAEILKGFQSRGYKLEYAEKLIAKAKRPKRVVACLAITVLLFFSLTFSAYTIFSDNQKLQSCSKLRSPTTNKSTKNKHKLRRNCNNARLHLIHLKRNRSMATSQKSTNPRESNNKFQNRRTGILFRNKQRNSDKRRIIRKSRYPNPDQQRRFGKCNHVK